ncbi:integral membrane protein, putative [Theileria annulata]|uniref:Integral membrane protein, putative n=1 Tax=Theileria annulata TaxID=5874 RepID=Q4UAN2_THEAN|nr:integral membrane protein, putative [Theileria annulata]CAI76119.1 integral membrane protein, putative [Theileria annulata]|eukprot:XP_952745.1 integral membrane protein, putative [Theileria annulata]
MNREKVALLSNQEDERLKNRDKSRFGVTFILCTMPLLDALFLVFCLTRKRFGRFFNLVNSVCLVYVMILIATTLLGYYGIYRKNYLALRSSISMFTSQNLFILPVCGIFLILFVVRPELLRDHHADPFFTYFEKHRILGILFIVFIILLRIANLLLTWYCGELESSFEVVNRLKHVKDGLDSYSNSDQFPIDLKDEFDHI